MRYLSILIAFLAIIGITSGASLENTVTVNAVDSLGNAVTASDKAMISVNETFSAQFFKDADVLTAKPGELVKYSYTFTNTGTGSLTRLTVTDDRFGTITMSKTTVAPGETVTGSKDYIIKESDLPGPLMNEAIAKTGEMEINATAYVVLDGTPAISIEKITSVDQTDIGKTVTYEFNVTNTGAVTLTIESVTDDKLGVITMPKTSIVPGETIVAKKDHVVVTEDLK